MEVGEEQSRAALREERLQEDEGRLARMQSYLKK